MEVKARKIGNSVGTIFPKDISPKVGDTFTIIKVGDTYVMKPKKENIFNNPDIWTGFRDSVSSEDSEWDHMALEGEEI